LGCLAGLTFKTVREIKSGRKASMIDIASPIKLALPLQQHRHRLSEPRDNIYRSALPRFGTLDSLADNAMSNEVVIARATISC
jgi:hypothetical protein